MTRRVLILGGTTEARELAARLAGREYLDVTVSLAGRTAEIVEHDAPVRVGGFGGAEGLGAFLRDRDIGVLVDATHPYAGIISNNAAEAAAKTGVAFMALRRPPWRARGGDRWREVADADAAVDALGVSPRSVFLALGRRLVAAFERAPQHRYLIRSIDPITPPPALPQVAYVTERGPFTEAGDRALLEVHKVDVVVARNSGGGAAYGKIAAARALGIEVIFLARPLAPDVVAVDTVDEAVTWLDHVVTFAAARGE